MTTLVTALVEARPVSFEGLPWLATRAADRSRALAALLGRTGGTGGRTVVLPGLGSITLGVRGVEPDPRDRPGELGATELSLPLRLGPGIARLSLDRGLALQLVYAALGAPPPRTLRALSPAERGVLLATVAAVLSRLGGEVGFGHEGDVVPSEWVAIDLDVAVVGGHGALFGSVQLALSTSFLAAAGAPISLPAGGPLALLPIQSSLVLGSTRLTAGVWAAARPGDAVVFEEHALPDEGAWPCRLALGQRDLFVEWLPGGDLRVRPLPPSPRSCEETMPDHDARSPRFEDPDVTEALAAAPVEVTAELGRLTLTGQEVLGLAKGAVIALGPRRRDQVVLRVGGRLWARGELVNVDDRLGVRLVSLHPPRPDASPTEDE